MNEQRRVAVIIVNGVQRKIKRVFSKHNGIPYKLIGTELRDDGRKIFLFSPNTNDPREASADEIKEFYQNYYRAKCHIKYL